MLRQEGLPKESALRIAREMATSKQVLLKTMVEKELGLIVEEGGSALRGAIVMGVSFGLASLVPILPYLFLPVAPPWMAAQLGVLNVMGLATPHSAILAAVIFNALIISALIPLALRGIAYTPLGAAAILLAAINIAGGFLVTQRMLRMFHR